MGVVTEYVDAVAERVRGPGPAKAGAEAMAKSMRAAVSTVLGGDLRMSGFDGSPVFFDPGATATQASLRLGGATYALADEGRHTKVDRIRPRQKRALSTPWGPRASVSGSTWAGFHLTERSGPEALQAGVDAIWAEIERQADG